MQTSENKGTSNFHCLRGLSADMYSAIRKDRLAPNVYGQDELAMDIEIQQT